MIAYHVDRRNKRYVGEKIMLNTKYFNDYGELGKHIYDIFPDGLSDNGQTYLDPSISELKLNHFSLDKLRKMFMIHNSHIIELVFELVRQLKYPNCPSRFQCYFGVPDLENFKLWGELNINEYKIYKFEVPDEQAFKFDANFLIGGISSVIAQDRIVSQFEPALITNFAEKYWSGTISDNPKFEILMTPPINVISKII